MSTVFGRHGSRDAFLYAFDILELDGQDLRGKGWDHRVRCWRRSSPS